MKKPSYKSTRRNIEVQRALADIINNDVKDPRIGALVSVTAVEVAPDLKTCKAYVSVYGGKEERTQTILALKNAHGFIKSRLAAILNMRNTPDITFIADESLDYGAKMSKLIDEVVASDAGGSVDGNATGAGDATDATGAGDNAGELDE